MLVASRSYRNAATSLTLTLKRMLTSGTLPGKGAKEVLILFTNGGHPNF